MRAVVFANGELNNKGAAGELLLPDDLLIAADGGASHCRVLGVTPSILIGDLDSLTEVDLAYWEQAGTKVIRYKSRKDETDLELALLHAKANGVDEVVVSDVIGTAGNGNITSPTGYAGRMCIIRQGQADGTAA